MFRIGWRYLLRRPWQTALLIVGITLGVAVAVAIDLANVSAGRAFELSTEALVGRATHQIVAGPGGLPIRYTLACAWRRPQSLPRPSLANTATSPQLGNRTLQLLGVDAFAEAPFRDYLDSGNGRGATAFLSAFLTQPGALLLSEDLAQRYNLSVGAPITLTVAGRARSALIAGVLQPKDDLSRRALDGLLLADIATAQELTGRLGRLDRVDLLLPQARTPRWSGSGPCCRLESALSLSMRAAAPSRR